MTEINDLVAELADDVYVRGISPSQPFKPMTNNEQLDEELTIDELSELYGGFIPALVIGGLVIGGVIWGAGEVLDGLDSLPTPSHGSANGSGDKEQVKIPIPESLGQPVKKRRFYASRR